jgi:hypothetical protein
MNRRLVVLLFSLAVGPAAGSFDFAHRAGA